MKNCKRLSCLIAVVLLCLLLVCPAYAVDSSAPELTDEILTDEDLFELEYERLLIEGMDDQAALFSLNDNDPTRTFVISDDGYIRWSGDGSTNFRYVPDNIPFTWEGNGAYRLDYYSPTSASNHGEVRIYRGTYLDINAPVFFRYAPSQKIAFEGTLRFGVIVTWFSQNAYVSGTSILATGIDAYPNRMAILVNGDVVTSVTASDSLGTFEISHEYEMTDNVTSLGYRFYYDDSAVVSGSYPNTSGTFDTAGLYFYFDDSAFVSEVSADVYLPLFQEVIQEVKLIPTTIYNFFFGDDGDDAAGGFKSDVDSAVSSVDQVQQEIVEGLDKPEPDAIVPDLEEVVPQEDYTVYTDIFAPVMQSSLFTSMMLIVVSMAFVSYVLFGKKG